MLIEKMLLSMTLRFCLDVIHSIRETKMELKKAKRKDFYKILGVTQSSTEHEIKKAYKKLALKYHPDRHASKTEEEKAAAEASFKDIGEAYSILSDPQKKQRYDSGVDLEDLDSDFGGGGMGGGMGGVDPSQIFQVRLSKLRTVLCDDIDAASHAIYRCSLAAAVAAWEAWEAWAAWAAWEAWEEVAMATATVAAASATTSANFETRESTSCRLDCSVRVDRGTRSHRRLTSWLYFLAWVSLSLSCSVHLLYRPIGSSAALMATIQRALLDQSLQPLVYSAPCTSESDNSPFLD